MNFKGNAFSLGEGKITSARQRAGDIHFLQQKDNVYVYKVFHPDSKSTTTLQDPISYADSCFFLGEGGLLELFGEVFKTATI